MEINPIIIETLRKCKIDKSQGLLCLLGIYYDLDVDSTCSEEVVSAINITKIVEKDYDTGSIKWNLPLFKGHEAHFDWVADWLQPFGRINPERKGNLRDCTTRMIEFFRKYPEYRKEDVYAARDLYLKTVTDARFLMKSHKFIFDGMGTMKHSTLLDFCEKLEKNSPTQLKGKIIT